jgi:hypothetical protein
MTISLTRSTGRRVRWREITFEIKICFAPARNFYALKKFSFCEWIRSDECFGIAAAVGVENIDATTRIRAGIMLSNIVPPKMERPAASATAATFRVLFRPPCLHNLSENASAAL